MYTIKKIKLFDVKFKKSQKFGDLKSKKIVIAKLLLNSIFYILRVQLNKYTK